LQEFRSCRMGTSFCLAMKSSARFLLNVGKELRKSGVAGVTGVQELQNRG
jgi:hypothetical protein